jgi:hypothetical protein
MYTIYREKTTILCNCTFRAISEYLSTTAFPHCPGKLLQVLFTKDLFIQRKLKLQQGQIQMPRFQEGL